MALAPQNACAAACRKERQPVTLSGHLFEYNQETAKPENGIDRDFPGMRLSVVSRSR
jgi:hypothetical protein